MYPKFFTELSLRPIPSTIGDGHRLSVCVFVPLRKTDFRVDWRPLVEGRIANIGMPTHNFSSNLMGFFFAF